ncbi:MAG: radical SAM protein [Deltaproteobacteria bacterium]|nr:MAG: radical SAM protein [Deltaproteobacteria bacterium]
MIPSYIELCESGKIDERIEGLYEILESCTLCPRECGVNRLRGERGYCGAEKTLFVSSAHPHFGEEEVLVGKYGSGTIFLTFCSLLCVYCQNYDISHLGHGSPWSTEELAAQMIALQKMGCHNINFVTPTHYTPQIVEGIKIAAENGLRIPIVYNCGGYEKVETLRFLDGIVDIYMPDMKYSGSEEGKRYSDAPDYFDICKLAVKEMHAQVGDLVVEKGIAQKGLLIRHLVLPNGLAGSEEILRFIVEEISPNTYVNIMSQYRPMYKAYEYSELSRSITMKEYNEVVEFARNIGLWRGFEEY